MSPNWAAAVAGPLTTVLLLGGAMTGAPLTAPPPQGVPVSYPSDLPAPPGPFNGSSLGCTRPDPTGTGGCVTPATAWMLGQVAATFGSLPTTCWDEHAWNPASDHPHGRACDFTFGRLGAFPSTADTDRGWLLAHWLRANAGDLLVNYVVWAGRIWSTSRADEGWRPYTGGGVYDPTDPTGGHYDHIHVSMRT